MVSKKYFGDDKNIEFKREIPSRHEKFLKDIIAFSNSTGGKVILGIEDETCIVYGIGEQSPFNTSSTGDFDGIKAGGNLTFTGSGTLSVEAGESGNGYSNSSINVANVTFNYGENIKPQVKAGNSASNTSIIEEPSLTTYTENKYVNIEPAYLLAVNLNGGNGTSGDYYTEGSTVNINAGNKTGCRFIRWEGSEGIVFGDSGSASTSFTMPAKVAAVDAVWISLVEPQSGTEVSVSGSNELTYGKSLSKLSLNTVTFVEKGTDNVVEGTLQWKDSTLQPNITDTTAEWEFIPTDSDNYEKLSGSVAIKVNNIPVTVSNKSGNDGYSQVYTYTGKEIAAPQAAQFIADSGSTDFTFTWYKDSVSEANKLAEGTRPSEIGTYILRVETAATTHYSEAAN